MYIIITGHSVDERENTAVCVEKMHVSDVLGHPRNALSLHHCRRSHLKTCELQLHAAFECVQQFLQQPVREENILEILAGL